MPKTNIFEQKLKLNIPADIKKIHKLFKKNKKQLYVVGGAVRDAILGKSPKDFDLATDAKPDEVLAIAKQGKFKTVEVGKSFGVVIVNGHEIATFRKDIGKGRRPDAVDFTDIKGDVKRRDLTINALFYDIDKNTIVDLVGGIKDLKKKQVRTVGSADERFDEDPLRKLRALRFQATIGGKLHPDTFAALKKNPSLKGVSSERIREEFVKSLIKAKTPSNYLKLANNFGMLHQILPGLSINKKFINSNDYIVQLAYLLKDNKPSKLGNKLNSIRYTVKESTNVLFLVSLQNFKSEEIYMFKKFQEKTNLTIAQIKEYGKLIGNESDVVKMAKFKLSIKSKDVSKDLKGPEIGKAIKTKEKEKFLNEIAVRPIKSFRDLYTALPPDLKKRVMNLKKVKQRKDAHPEGNVLKHTITVVNRAMKLNPGDIDLAVAALFHDIGKDETAGIHPKKGHPTHYGHEHVSAKLVKKYRTWIKSMGGNPVDIYYIVKQHMRVKNVDVMKLAKQRKLKQFRSYDKLKKFSDKMDKGGLKVDEEFGAPAGILPGPSRKAVKKNKTDKKSGYKQIEETSKIKKVIAIYPGRFQPFGPHHKKVYLALKKKFGDVYIVTSNIQKPPRHPMNFKEKAQHMIKMGIPSNKIIMDNPYKPVNLLKKFKPEETAVVFAVGQKDKGRLSGGQYFTDYNKNKNDLKGYKEHGYVLKAPHISVNIAGKEVSGTTMRKILSSPKIKPEQRKKLFKLLFGYFNGSVYNMMIGNFKNV
jgi:putative nucleotidyltransferase with HDIG domain